MLSDRIFVKDRNQLVRLYYNDIISLESNGNYCFVLTSDKRYVINISLKQFLNKLPHIQFVRIHQRYIINVEKMEGINLKTNKVSLGEKYYPIGKSFKDKLLNRINII